MEHKIDIGHLKTFVIADNTLIKKLLNSFVTNVPTQLEELRGFILANDKYNASETAHKLKSPFLYFGLTSVAERLERIEQNIVNIPYDELLVEAESLVEIGKDCAKQALVYIEELT